MSEAKFTRKRRMSFRDAMDIAEAMDLPDGAFWAMSHELAGLDYGDGFDELDPGLPAFTVSKALRAKIEKHGELRTHSRYHMTVRRDGKVIADWWPHKGKWRIGGANATGDSKAFLVALAKASPAQTEYARQRREAAVGLMLAVRSMIENAPLPQPPESP